MSTFVRPLRSTNLEFVDLISETKFVGT